MKNANKSVARANKLRGSFTKKLFLEKCESFICEVDGFISNFAHNESTTSWRDRVETFLCHSLGDDCAQTQEFKNVPYIPLFFSTETSQSVFDECYNKGLKSARRILKVIADEVRDYFPGDDNQLISTVSKSVSSMTTKDVFIVHGHDEVMLYKVKDFLKTLGLTPIVLREQANEGKTIIEKFEKVASAVGFAIVLLTADDVGRAKVEHDLKNRARQNVVFELGYFTGKFGRSHIAALCDMGIETPGDIAGVVYIPIDEAGAWMLSVARDMRKAGMGIDMNKIA